MKTLMDATEGAYQVVTGSSSYLIDSDREVICRSQRTANSSGSLLRRDASLVTYLQLVECTVRRSMQLLIDLHLVIVPHTVLAIDRRGDNPYSIRPSGLGSFDTTMKLRSQLRVLALP